MTQVFPTITAHTGCDGTAENTVESARRGFELGADVAEVDVRADPDGRLFLWHHGAVQPRAGGAVPVSSLRLDEIRSLDPEARLTTFEELAAALIPMRGQLNLDLKDDRSARCIGGAVRAAGLDGRVVITGCGIGWVRLVKDTDPSLPVFLNSGFGGGPPDTLSRARIEEECRVAAGAGCCGLNVYHRLCASLLVDTARAHELLVSVWTVAPEDGFARFADMGVDNITTRHVAALAALRRERSGGGPLGHSSVAPGAKK